MTERDMADQVICKINNKLGCLTLNRPQALHALNYDMCKIMLDALMEWRGDDKVQAVWIDHAAGTRGFCAGGDVRALAESGQTDAKQACAFFHLEYRLNHLIKTYPKPIIAIMDGVTMGGGVGISVHGTYRVATQNTLFAMPETSIGLMPDVGGGWFLPRLPGQIGMWLALTGSRLKAADCLSIGLVTHFAESAQLADLQAEIQTALAQNQALTDILATPRGQPNKEEAILTQSVRALIDKHFAPARAEDIFASLQAESDDWAAAQLSILAKQSPQTIKVAMRQLQEGAKMPDFAANMAMEYTAASRVVRQAEFFEGVRAVLIDKDNAPKWQYAHVGDVPDSEIEALFAPLPKAEQWTPLD
ncbi:MAG: enoyl-CoA hydratase/isomerase family protein [Alphaproteobacteria bacterium]|nr:enoyl-CoA hydratase/isomerase family protein [Alphaproteobacteria bacterium]